ncbi:MAG: EamA family transporter [Opitutaceae bacterium]|nr:EamA family transporter [Opitutaceae bacterium]
MTPLALILVLTAAVLHATWNLCAKRAGGGLPFVYLVSLIICTIYLPVVAIYWWWKEPVIPWVAVGWIIGSGVLKTLYSLFLQRSYRTGDFSLIYPLARGTGPLLSTLAAILVLGERPSTLALLGAALIVVSIFFLTGGARLLQQDRAHLRRAVGYGVTSGVFIAAYTLWDRQGVAGLLIAPLLYDAGTAFTQLLLLSPFGIRRRAEVQACWRTQRRYAFGVALLSPLAYVLILTALAFTPISYVAPAREISIVIGAFIGAKMLNESDGTRRLWAAGAIAIGVIALAIG